MHADCYYEIGHTHTICEDYALSESNVLNFAIVSDGCSACSFVDVGARILSHCTKDYLHKYPSIDDFSIIPILESANKIREQLSLYSGALDCTLLVALNDGKKTKVIAYGDGCILVKYRSGKIEYFRIHFTSGAPFYPFYLLNTNELKDYLLNCKGEAIIRKHEIVNDQITNVDQKFYSLEDIHSNSVWSFEDVEFVSVMSDGIESYENDANGIPVDQIIKRVIGYKSFQGWFVERKMKWLKKELAKENIRHYDDISIGTVYLGDKK